MTMGLPDNLSAALTSRIARVRCWNTTLPASGPTRIIGPHSLRIGIGFFIGAATSRVDGVFPFPVNGVQIGWSITPTAPLWFDLVTYGALVGGEWWYTGTASATITITEHFIRG